ncbi:MAG: hypothetical protein ACLT98_00430 [Eggerthellaceae bacterium]
MQPLEIDSAVFCDGAALRRLTRTPTCLTCPVTSGAGGCTLNRVGKRNRPGNRRPDERAACIAVGVPTWCASPATARRWPTRSPTCWMRRRPASSEQLAAASPPHGQHAGIPCSREASRPPRAPRSPGAAAPRSCAGCRARLRHTLMAARRRSRRPAVRREGPGSVRHLRGLFSATVGISRIDTAEIGVNCVDAQ